MKVINIKTCKRQEFIDRMKTLRNTFEKEDPGFADAYKNMYRLIGE